MAELCYLSALRGTDSTGIAIGYRKKKEHNKFGVYSHKMTVPAADFLRDEHTKAAMSANSFFIIGHCRAKTIGASTIENAHPHECEHIVGTHNGTIGKWGDDNQSDSRVLFDKIAKDGITKAFSEADTGAYATVFADKRARTINFFRNEKRPLWLMWADNEKTLYWASEREMLELMTARNNIGRTAEEPWLLKEHTLFSIPFGSIDAKIDHIKITPPVYTPTKYTSFSWPKKEAALLPAPEKKTLAELINPSCSDDKGKCDLHDPPSLHTFPEGKHYDDKYYQCIPLKGIIPREEADLCLDIGCSGCGTTPHVSDETVEWRALDAFLCGSCKKDEFANLYAIPNGTVHCG